MSNEFEGKYRIIYRNKEEMYTYKGYEVGIYHDGAKHYLLDWRLHREDGPAIIAANRSRCWYLYGDHYSEEEYCIIQKFCSHCNTIFNTLNDLMGHYKVEQIKYPKLNKEFQKKIDSIYLQFIK